MKAKTLVLRGAIAAMVALAISAPARIATGAEAPHEWFGDGAPSVDELVKRFMVALEAKDKTTVHQLRVTEQEYRGLILPGSVDVGRPRASYTEQESQYFWSVIDTKSVYVEANVLAAWGGRPLKLKKVTYRGGTKTYADYKAYKQLVLTIENEKGEEDELRIGSVAEVDGRYKFISYVRS